MTTVRVLCDNCGAEPRLPAELVTMTVDLEFDRCAVVYACPMCGATSERGCLDVKTQTILLDAGASLAVRGV